MRFTWERQLNLTGGLLAGSIWLLAAVLAWPLSHPTVAAIVLSCQAAGYLLLGVFAGERRR